MLSEIKKDVLLLNIDMTLNILFWNYEDQVFETFVLEVLIVGFYIYLLIKLNIQFGLQTPFIFTSPLSLSLSLLSLKYLTKSYILLNSIKISLEIFEKKNTNLLWSLNSRN